jgi:hypothetical protein
MSTAKLEAGEYPATASPRGNVAFSTLDAAQGAHSLLNRVFQSLRGTLNNFSVFSPDRTRIHVLRAAGHLRNSKVSSARS